MLALFFHVMLFNLTVSYMSIRGEVVVRSSYTDNDHTTSYTITCADQSVLRLDFTCRQIKHVVRYLKWGFLNTVKYIYVVEVVKTVEGKQIGTSQGFYPHIGFKFLHTTKQPHRCAINAMIDCFR